MTKSKPKGRNNGPPFAAVEKITLEKEEWKQLTRNEMLTYIYLKANFTGYNNGRIPLTYSSMKRVFAPATLKKALQGLIDKGWIEKTEEGGRIGCPCLYRLTWKYDYCRFE